MGGNVSKQEVLNETLNQIQIDSMTKNSTSANANVKQDNTIDLSNNAGTANIVGYTQSNINKINLSALAQTTNNASLQADLVSKLSAAVSQTAPTLAINSSTTQTVTNQIKNVIGVSMSTQNLSSLAARVEQANKALLGNNTGTLNLVNVNQSNTADVVIQLVTTNSATISAAVQATGQLDSQTEQKQASLFDLSTVIIICIIIAVFFIFGGATFNQTLSTITKPVPMATMGCTGLAYYYMNFIKQPSKFQSYLTQPSIKQMHKYRKNRKI